LKDTKKFVQIGWDKSTRCVSCGSLLPIKQNKLVSKTKCIECLDESDTGQEVRMKENLKQFIKTLKK
jgi:hypothetical protein